MKKVIRLTENDLVRIVKKVISEQKNSVIDRIYNRVKNNPTFKKIQSLYDKDITTFVKNVVNSFPKLKNKESDLLNLVNQGMKEPDTFITKYEGELDKKNIQEQAVILFSLGFFALLVIIASLTKGPKIKSCVTSQEPTDRLKSFVGKTVNLYNDEGNEYLYGREIIRSAKFENCGTEGSNKVIIYTNSLGKLQISCLYNSKKLDSRIVSLVQDSKGKNYVETVKYNKNLTDELTNVVSQYCIRPSADFAVNKNPNQSNIA